MITAKVMALPNTRLNHSEKTASNKSNLLVTGSGNKAMTLTPQAQVKVAHLVELDMVLQLDLAHLELDTVPPEVQDFNLLVTASLL